jgi:hypothetical protein
MTKDELDAVCTEVAGYFPTVAMRLSKAPKLLMLWRQTLQEFSAPLVLEALARAAAKNSRSLELDELLTSINTLTQKQQRYSTSAAPRSQTTRKADNSQGQLIARLHCKIIYAGLHLPHAQVQQQAAAQWRHWAEEYPGIRQHCLEQAEACAQFGSRPPATAGHRP